MIFDRHGNPAPRFVPPPRPACPTPHNDPALMIVHGFDTRGYARMECPTCRRFIGYRPPATARDETKKATEEIDFFGGGDTNGE